jgi:hypothetical protein
MNNKGKEAAQRLLAIIVIMAMLGVMGIPFSVIIFFATVTFFIWRAVQHTEHQETGRIFEFYIAANDVLRDEERHWFGFEIAEVIERGESILRSMSDPPPLIYFSLGALYHKAGDHEAAAEHLSYIVENDLSDERHRLSPSAELRRYVHILRKLEREPAVACLGRKNLVVWSDDAGAPLQNDIQGIALDPTSCLPCGRTFTVARAGRYDYQPAIAAQRIQPVTPPMRMTSGMYRSAACALTAL